MQQEGPCNGTVSVRLSRLQAGAAGLLLWARRAGWRAGDIDQQRLAALSGKV